MAEWFLEITAVPGTSQNVGQTNRNLVEVWSSGAQRLPGSAASVRNLALATELGATIPGPVIVAFLATGRSAGTVTLRDVEFSGSPATPRDRSKHIYTDTFVTSFSLVAGDNDTKPRLDFELDPIAVRWEDNPTGSALSVGGVKG